MIIHSQPLDVVMVRVFDLQKNPLELVLLNNPNDATTALPLRLHVQVPVDEHTIKITLVHFHLFAIPYSFL